MAEEVGQNTTQDVGTVTETPTQNTQEVGTQEPTVDDIGDIANEISKEVDDVEPSPNQDDTKPQPKPEEVEDKNDEVKEIEDFDPNDVDFDEDKTKDEDKEDDTPIYKNIEGYDLDKFKDILDFDNEESVSFIKGQLKTLKEAGFNQSQAELFINSHLQKYMEEQEQEKLLNSKEHITQNLKTKLTKEEQRNYKSITSYMNDMSDKGAFPKEWVKDIMSNPNLVKVFNSIYKNQTNTNTITEVPNPKPKVSMDTTTALGKYKEWIVAQPKVTLEQSKNFVESLRQHIDDKEMSHFDEVFSSILKK